MLYEMMKPPVRLENAIRSRMKVMSQLDIAERRLPQDGRIKLKLGKGREMDYRVSCLRGIDRIKAPSVSDRSRRLP